MSTYRIVLWLEGCECEAVYEIEAAWSVPAEREAIERALDFYGNACDPRSVECFKLPD